MGRLPQQHIAATSTIASQQMFSIFKKDPAKKLNKLYGIKLEQAMQAQRTGDIQGYSDLTVEADLLYKQILKLEQDLNKK
ncbi:MAG: hypothetical protein ACJAWL_002115 [Motiliproteus sp.]